MSKNTIDTLKQAETKLIDFDTFTDEQVEAVIIYLAKIARETNLKFGLTNEQAKERYDKFFAIMDSWPEDFQIRVRTYILKTVKKQGKEAFWVVPADAMILATKSVEFA
jgi:hypothetical protein